MDETMKRILIALLIALPFWANGQCYPDRHNTSWNESWISCEVRQNPNPSRGDGHWILYDFGNTYRLGQTHIWNLNDPKSLDNGFKTIAIDYSLDGKNWKTLGDFEADRASGLSVYEGSDLAHFSGDTARFVLLSALGNWGGDCYGFSEVRIDVVETIAKLHTYAQDDCFTVSIFPNPHAQSFNLKVNSICNGDFRVTLFDQMGRAVRNANFRGSSDYLNEEINTGGLARGMYHLVIYQGTSVSRFPVMKSF